MARVEVKMEGGHAQVLDRYPAYFNDEQKRTWSVNMSKKSGAPADYPTPTRWTAPLSPTYLRGLFVPPPQYRKVIAPEGEPMHIRIDYDGWISDLQVAEQHHDQTKVDVINHQAQGFDAIRLMENPPQALLKIIGPGPFPPLEVIEYMAEGDAWALGLTEKVPGWFTKAMHDQIVHTARMTGLMQSWQMREVTKAERSSRRAFLPDDGAGYVAKVLTPKQEARAAITAETKWPAFRGIYRKRRMADAEIGVLWKEHRDTLEAAQV